METMKKEYDTRLHEEAIIAGLIRCLQDHPDKFKEYASQLEPQMFWIPICETVFKYLVNHAHSFDLDECTKAIESTGFDGIKMKNWLGNILLKSTGIAHVPRTIKIIQDAYEKRGGENQPDRSPFQDEYGEPFKKDSLDWWTASVNQRYAVALYGNKTVIVSPEASTDNLAILEPKDFKLKLAPYKVSVDNKPMPLSKFWLESVGRREYKGIHFHPFKDKKGWLNLWEGFAVEPKKGKWKKLQDHIYEIICNCDLKLMEWVMAWMADIVQNLGKDKKGTALVLQGGQGAGKGIFARCFGRLFGRHFKPISQSHQITGRFNDTLQDALLVFLDEAFYAGDKSQEGVLKNIITEDTITIERKFHSPVMIQNFAYFIFASNKEWVVPADMDSRRFCVLRLDNSKANNAAYFKPIMKEMANGGYEAMLYDLLNYPIKVDLRKVPQTAALDDQKEITEAATDSVATYLKQIKKDGKMWTLDGYEREIAKQDLYKDYLAFCKDTGVRYREKSNVQFAKKLKKHLPGLDEARPHGKPRTWILPALEDEDAPY